MTPDLAAKLRAIAACGDTSVKVNWFESRSHGAGFNERCNACKVKLQMLTEAAKAALEVADECTFGLVGQARVEVRKKIRALSASLESHEKGGQQ